jgi:hypothetical protein
MSELPLYLGDGDERMFAVYHPADGAGSAVLFCPPFGWDDICSYRSRRVWAERLAAHGYPTLRSQEAAAATASTHTSMLPPCSPEPALSPVAGRSNRSVGYPCAASRSAQTLRLR